MSESPLPAFADLLGTALLVHDPETGAVLDANAAAEGLYGYSTAALRERGVTGISTESPRFSEETALQRIRAAAEGDEQTFEWQVRRSDSEMRWIQVRLRRVTLEETASILAEIQDITEFKRRTRRLQLLHRIIRHNLRNEMSVVIGHAGSLEQALEDDNHEQQVEVIKRVADDVSRMTESVSRIEEIASNDSADFSPTDVPALLDELAGEFESEFPEASVTVEVETEAGVVVSADRGLRYGLEHAIRNAIQHNDGDRPEVVLRAARDDRDSRGVIQVVDDGPAIPDVEVDAIDADADISEMKHGSGVGLFVMKWCAESLGGRLEVHADDSRGNVVEFTLPLLDAEPGE
jgi:PAS domain S-box-containing protein